MNIPKFVYIILGLGGSVSISFGISTIEFTTIIGGIIAVISAILMLFHISTKPIELDSNNQLSPESKWAGSACGKCGYRVKDYDVVINDKCPRCKNYDLNDDELHYGI